MTNYKIILDEEELYNFISWLPELEVGECYYVVLFARKKYHSSAKNDKSQCRRFTATSKEWLIKKIKQLEIPLGTYTNKDGSAVDNSALALYITVNLRSFMGAQRLLLKKLADTITANSEHANPSALAMSSIQKAKSRTIYVDFDFDGVELHEIDLNKDAYEIIQTRGGYHILVNPVKVDDKYKKTWYNNIKDLAGCDVKGDNLIPVPGCIQGDFCLRLIRGK